MRPNGGLDAGPGELGREHPAGQLPQLLERRVRVGHQRLELVRYPVLHRRPGHPQLVRQHDESRQHLVGDRLLELPAGHHVRLEDPGPGLRELSGGPIEVRDVVGELGLHGRVAERDRRLVGDGDQQSLVGRAQRASVEHVDLDAAERDVTVANGYDVCGRGVVGPLRAPGGRRDDHAGGRVQRGGRTPRGHGAAGRLRDGGQQLRGRRGVGQPAAEARERLVGLGPRAVGDPVGHPDHRSAQRLEGQRDHRRREEREQQSAGAGVDESPDHDDHRRVADSGEREADREHQRAVDHHLDVVEPVAQRGQRERHRQQHVGDQERKGRHPGLLATVQALHDQRVREADDQRRDRQRDQPDLLSFLSLAAAQPDPHGDQRGDQAADDHEEAQGEEGAAHSADVRVPQVELHRVHGHEDQGADERSDPDDACGPAPAAREEVPVGRQQEHHRQLGEGELATRQAGQPSGDGRKVRGTGPALVDHPDVVGLGHQ